MSGQGDAPSQSVRRLATRTVQPIAGEPLHVSVSAACPQRWLVMYSQASPGRSCFFFGDGDSSVHSDSSGAVLFAGVDGAPTDAPPRTERPDTALPSFEAVIDRGGVFVDGE